MLVSLHMESCVEDRIQEGNYGVHVEDDVFIALPKFHSRIRLKLGCDVPCTWKKFPMLENY